VLKVAGLVIDGGYVFDYQPQTTRQSWAQETFNFPTGRNNAADITGSVQEKPKEEAAKPAATAAPDAAKLDVPIAKPEQIQPVSPSERAILERLQSRRQELEARSREIDIRESLLKGRRKAHRSPGRGIEGGRIADLHGERTEERSRCRALQGHRHDV
jgi:type IV secretory pathway VirB10-like protein